MMQGANHGYSAALRELAFVGLALGAIAGTGPAALGQTVQPTGVRGAAPPAVASTDTDLTAAGVVVPGQLIPPASAVPEVETAPAPPAGSVNPSGVVGSPPSKPAPLGAAGLAAAGIQVN